MYMFSVFIKFTLAAAAIFWGSKHLTHLSDVLAETKGWSKGWVGLILLAFITSLPEAATSITAVALGNVDVAAGNILGSNVFNLTLIGIFSIAQVTCFWHLLSPEQVLNGSLVIVLTLLVILGFAVPLLIGWVSFASILILMAYLLGMHRIYSYHKEQNEDLHPVQGNKDEKNDRLYLQLGLVAGVVVMAGIVIAQSAGEIAQVTGLSNTFVGSLFAALATSLPEVGVSYHAIKIGEMDMAIGNLLGSNLFNTILLCLTDVLYTNGSIFAHISGGHLFSCLTILFLTGIVLFSLHYGLSKPRWAKSSPWLMSVIYLNYLWFLQ